MCSARGGAGGNPCPVVLGADDLDDEQLRGVAAHYGMETAFVLPSAITLLRRQGVGPATVDTPRGVVPVSWRTVR